MERTKYSCSNCNYKFTRKANQAVLRCPYCSRENTVEEHKGDFASRILEEVY